MVDQQRRSAAVDAAWYAMPAICTRMPAVLLLELLYAAWLAAHVAAALAAELMISCVTISGSRESKSVSTIASTSASSSERAPPSPATAQVDTKSPCLRRIGKAADT